MRDHYTDRDHPFTAGPSAPPSYAPPPSQCAGDGCRGTACHCQWCGDVAPLNDIGECKACASHDSCRENLDGGLDRPPLTDAEQAYLKTICPWTGRTPEDRGGRCCTRDDACATPPRACQAGAFGVRRPP